MPVEHLSLRDALSEPSPPPDLRPAVAIQARMGSTRFPGKVMAPLAGRKVIDWVFERAAAASTISLAVVLTSTAARDDVIAEWARARGAECIRGDEEDVLSRYLYFSRTYRPAAVVRITADCPLVDPEIIDAMVKGWWRRGDPAEYCSNILHRTFPDGLDAEVISSDTLERLDAVAAGPHREHVTSYIATHPEEFDCVSIEADVDCSQARITLDTPGDLEAISRLIEDEVPPLEGPRWFWLFQRFDCKKI